MNGKKHTKPYDRMTSQELAKAAAKFDAEIVIDSSREQTSAERAQWQRAKRKRGRPRVGRGVQVISVSIEKGLLKKTDQLAKKLGVRRTQLISRGLEAVLSEQTMAE
jgi:hypothetical protein